MCIVGQQPTADNTNLMLSGKSYFIILQPNWLQTWLISHVQFYREHSCKALLAINHVKHDEYFTWDHGKCSKWVIYELFKKVRYAAGGWTSQGASNCFSLYSHTHTHTHTHTQTQRHTHTHTHTPSGIVKLSMSQYWAHESLVYAAQLAPQSTPSSHAKPQWEKRMSW